jgi:hypothetical protein
MLTLFAITLVQTDSLATVHFLCLTQYMGLILIPDLEMLSGLHGSFGGMGLFRRPRRPLDSGIRGYFDLFSFSDMAGLSRVTATIVYEYCNKRLVLSIASL